MQRDISRMIPTHNLCNGAPRRTRTSRKNVGVGFYYATTRVVIGQVPEVLHNKYLSAVSNLLQPHQIQILGTKNVNVYAYIYAMRQGRRVKYIHCLKLGYVYIWTHNNDIE